MTEHNVATREEWLTARKELLAREKELTRQSDELARQRVDLPWGRNEQGHVHHPMEWVRRKDEYEESPVIA